MGYSPFECSVVGNNTKLTFAKFDICDPEQHFTLAVPQRARRCPPLLHAIFTVAARHLVHIQRYRTADGVVEYEGIRLPALTANTAIEYHNTCLAYLIELSNDPEHMKDENLLAATIILRYYEELDASLTGEDVESFLHTFQVFINAQANTAFPSLANDRRTGIQQGPWQHVPLSDHRISYERSFRHAAFRMALRQEVTSAFMKQRAVRLPLDAWASQRCFKEAEDDVWTDRLILYSADVLQFCFGDEMPAGKTRTERWKELKEFEDLWEIYKPISFSHIQYQEPHRSQGHCFPRIWYMAECHVLGMQHLDLARILLTLCDPSMQRLGPSSITAVQRISPTVREIALRICGNAISNRAMQPAQINAHLAIALCGEYFIDKDEQKCITEVLVNSEAEHAWPTAKTIAELKKAWTGSESLR